MTPPEDTQPMRQIIIDVYRAICGVEPSEDEIKARLESKINTYDLVKDVLFNDGKSVYVKEVARLIGELIVKNSEIDEQSTQNKDLARQLNEALKGLEECKNSSDPDYANEQWDPNFINFINSIWLKIKKLIGN